MAKGKGLEKRLDNHPLFGFLSKKRNGSYEYTEDDCVILIKKDNGVIDIKIQSPEHYFNESYIEGENQHLKRGQKPLKKGYVVTQTIHYDRHSGKLVHGLDFQNFPLPLGPGLSINFGENIIYQTLDERVLSDPYASFIRDVLDSVFAKIKPS